MGIGNFAIRLCESSRCEREADEGVQDNRGKNLEQIIPIKEGLRGNP